MKVAKILAAIGLVTATLGIGVTANAQHRQVEVRRTVVTSRHTTHRGPRHDQYRRHHREVCKTVWRHHRRVRVCR